MNLEQSNPLVTVYIPTFNRVELLKRAVDSVRKQTYKNLEIIIVDDCSTDSTHDYLQKLVNQDERVRYFIKEKNSGACVSRNIAIENAKGEFITGLDDDDYFIENRIEEFFKYWDSGNKNLVGLCTPIFSNNSRLSVFKFFSRLFDLKKIKKRDLYFANYVGNQIFTKTELLQKIGGFDINLPAWQDFDTWFRLLELGYIKKIKNPTYFVDRSHEMGRITSANVNKILVVYNYFIKKHEVSNKVYLLALRNHLFHYVPDQVGVSSLIVKFLFHPLDFKGNFIYLFSYFKFILTSRKGA